mgnify:CR=1 FL=1
MADRKITYKFDAEGDDLKQELREQNRHLDETAQKTRQAGEEATTAGGRMRGLRTQVGNLATGLKTLVAGWLTLTALHTVVVGFFRAIADAARNAVAAIAELGEAVEGLSANIGGSRADRTVAAASRMAMAHRIGIAGRTSLIGAASAITDRQPDIAQVELESRLNTLARLDRATDLQGSEAAGVVMGLQSVLGTDFATAADRAATLANAGFDARTIQRITEQGGVLEGEDLFSLFMAARQENIDPNTVGEGFLTLRNALSRTDAEGRVAPALRAIGLEPGQPFVEQLRLLRTAQRQGRVDYGQIGGTRAQSTAEFFFRALDRLPAARADFTGGTIDQELARRNQSAYIQAMERQLMRELRVKLAEERSGMGGFGEAYAEGQTTFQEIAGGDYTGSTALGVLRSMWNPHAAYRADARRLYYQGRRSPMLRPEAAARAVGVPLEEYLQNTDGNGVTYNDYRIHYNYKSDPMTTPSDR